MVLARKLAIESLEDRQLLSVSSAQSQTPPLDPPLGPVVEGPAQLSCPGTSPNGGIAPVVAAPATALAPTVTGTTPALVAGALEAGTQVLAVRFSAAVAGAGTASNYELRAAGLDGLLGTSDDLLQPLTVSYRGAVATLTFPSLKEDVYRFTVRDAITNLDGDKLDGDGNGTGGGNWVRDFVVTPSSKLFDGTPNYVTGGTRPQAMAVSDVNGDGLVDVVVANNNGRGSIAVLLGNGTGGFAAPVTFSTGIYYPRSLAVADFNADGKCDVAVANSGDSTVAVLLGNGAGGFTSVATFACGGVAPTQQALAVADFNGDGKMDVVVANGSSNTISVLFGDGSGRLGSVAQVPTGGSYAYSVAVGNFNGDSRSDIAVCNVNNSTLSVLLNNGNGGFSGGVVYTGSYGVYSVAVGDLDADGKNDLALGAGTGIGVLFGDGSGGFANFRQIPGSGHVYSVLTGDFNGDNRIDVASGGVWVALNQGGGSFTTRDLYSVGALSDTLALGDFNADGNVDLVAANRGSDSVGVLLGAGDGTFVATKPISTVGGYSNRLVTADFNGDGRLDLAVAGYSSSGVNVLLANGSGGFASPVNYSTGGQGYYLATGDFNGDGKVDLVVTNYNYSGGTASVLLGDGVGGFAAPRTFSTGGTLPTGVTVADVNRDGRSDLAIINAVSNQVAIFLGNGAGSFTASATLSSGTSYARSVAIGDFNGDGKPDLVMTTLDNTAMFFGNGSGGFTAAGTLAAGSTPENLLARDFNADSRLDLLVVDRTSDYVTLLLGNGSGGFSSSTSFYAGASCPNAVALGDFNRDGKTDLALSTDYGAVTVLLGNGPASFATPVSFASGSEAACDIVAGDFTQDGQVDLLVGNEENSSVALLSNIFGSSPITLAAPGGMAFDVATGQYGSGELVQGTNNAFDGYGRLVVGGTAYQPTLFNATVADGGCTVATGSGTAAGLTVSREVTVPATGSETFVRTVDAFTNTSGVPITTTVRVIGNLGSDGATTVFATSDGDSIIETTDQWIGTDDANNAGTPAIIHYIHGPSGLQPSNVVLNGDNIEWTYQITVAAGSTLRLAHYAILAPTRAQAQAAAQVLVTNKAFGGQAAAFLDANELASLTNFQFNNAPYVGSILVDDGAAERSLVKSLTVVFSTEVTLDADAFEIIRTGSAGGAVDVSFVTSLLPNGCTQAVLSFSGALTQYGSLIDGNYRLTIHRQKVHDAVSGVAMAEDRVFGSQAADAFFRLYGDSDGDRDVDNLDFCRLRLALGTHPGGAGWQAYFDFNNDGTIDDADVAQFRSRYLTRLAF
jgi:hypothetical protein